VNDILSDTPVGSGFSIVYNNNPGGGGIVTVKVIAVDTAGNASEPATITINMDLPEVFSKIEMQGRSSLQP